MPYHDALTAPDAIHPAAFVAATDPALDAANQVGPHKLWIDTAAAPWVLKLRNAANTAWDAISTVDHGALGGLSDDDHPQYVLKTLVDAKGDLLVATGPDALGRLAVGVADEVLTTDPTAPTGLLWRTLPASLLNPMTAAEDLIKGGTSGAPTNLAKGADGEVLTVVSGALAWAAPGGGATLNQRRTSVAFQLGDGVNAITTAEREQWLEVTFDGTIEGWSLLADAAGSIVVDVWKDVRANHPPTVADTITAAAKPTLSSAVQASDSALTGWTTALARGDVLKIHVDSAATLRAATLTLFIVKS